MSNLRAYKRKYEYNVYMNISFSINPTSKGRRQSIKLDSIFVTYRAHKELISAGNKISHELIMGKKTERKVEV